MSKLKIFFFVMWVLKSMPIDLLVLNSDPRLLKSSSGSLGKGLNSRLSFSFNRGIEVCILSPSDVELQSQFYSQPPAVLQRRGKT